MCLTTAPLFPGLFDHYAVAVKLHMWKASGPQVRDDGVLTTQELDKIVEMEGEREGPVYHCLSPKLMGYFYDKLKIGHMVILGAKSASPDIVVKVGNKEVIEFQMKSGRSKITHAQIQKEIQQSVIAQCPGCGYRSTFVVICASGITFDVSKKRIPPLPNMDLCIPTTSELEHFFGAEVMAQFKEQHAT